MTEKPTAILLGSRRLPLRMARWVARITVCQACLTFRLLIHAAGLAPELPTLHTAAEVRNLPPAEAERHYPVHLTGLITFFDQETPLRAFRFFQDQTAGIYMYPEATAGTVNLETGQQVEIEGQSDKGEYAPVVLASHIRVLGKGVFPIAKPASFEQLLSGHEDSQFVEVQGIARAVRRDAQTNYYSIVLATGGGRLIAYARELPVDREDELEDRAVKVRGVCMTQFNLQRQLFDVRLVIPRREDLIVAEAVTRSDPFSIPAQPIGSLLQFSPSAPYNHRVKVTGTVTYRQSDNALYIQDETEGLYAETSQRGMLYPGDKVEVLGFPAKGEYTPMLQDAIFRKIGSTQEPTPDKISTDEALKGTHDCRLVLLEATLLDRSHRGREGYLVLQAGDIVFQAVLENMGSGIGFSYLKNGSKVAVTGVCTIEKGSDWFAGGDWRASSFRLLLRSPADISVVRAAPWWTLERLLWIAALLGAVALGAFAWVAILRRRVRQQTEIIGQKLQAEGALKERYQDLFENANDIVYTHDLNGRLTSINHAGERLLNRQREEILSRNIIDLIVPEQQAAARQWLEQVLRQAAPDTSEWDFATATGAPLKLEISTRLIEQQGRQAEVEGIARDVSERKRLERELIEISNREQRRIGHDLHDGVCQQLVGIGYLSETLADRLQEKGAAESADAERISKLIHSTLAQTRGVARGLFPVRLEQNGLISALEELAATSSSLFSFACRVEQAEAPPVIDNTIALHLYYIAQEAVANAAKHGKAKTVVLRLARGHNGYVLSIQDDGLGFTVSSDSSAGMGLRIMRYRAAVIGATLEIRSRPAAGTMIQCLFTPVFRKVTQTDEAKSGNEGRQPGVETSTYEPAKTI